MADGFVLVAVCTNDGGIMKTPREGALAITVQGVAGDKQRNKKYHGGPDQAVCLYAQEDYHWLHESGLSAPLPHGAFGENFTTRGIDWREVAIGQRFRGEQSGVTIEVSAFRIPCHNLKPLSDALPGCITADGRTGAYARVIMAGETAAGERFTTISRPDHPLTIRRLQQLFEMAKTPATAAEAAREALNAPALAARMRKFFQSNF